MAAAAAAASCSYVLPQQKYDVFLSFRGVDTRRTFTCHLYGALKRKHIDTYMDDRLERGDDIEDALLTAIQQSQVSVIIFSENYASSSWCLDELGHIVDCRERDRRFVIIPVFYHIDPSQVRYQLGSYADAFAKLGERFEDNKLRMWRKAMTVAANLSGFASENMRNEYELVEEIVKYISMNLASRYSSIDLKGLVGIESHIQQIDSLLCIHEPSVRIRIVGIWGMGGIGKTTIADAVFHSLSAQFDACSFVANVRGRSQKDGLDHLRNELLRNLLDEHNLSIGTPSIGSDYVKKRLSHTKVLIVLDDVSDSTHLEFLLGDKVLQFGPGSRVIVTTKNRGILKGIVDDKHVYRVMGLNSADALELFQLKAFKGNSSAANFLDLSRKVVDYANGIPLVLQVLASSFLQHCNTRQEWEDELNLLTAFPNEKLQNVLRLSYEGLENHEKRIFFKIACFLKGEKISNAKRILDTYGFHASRGISILEDMSLISISKDNRLQMHDLVQEMGCSIVQEEEPGKRSMLLNKDATGGYFNKNTSREVLRGLDLQTGVLTFEFKQIKVATDDFAPANKIGEGGFGSVYKGILLNGTKIAVKQLSAKSKQGNREFVNEVGIISAIQHPNVVRLYGCCIEANQLLLVYEYMENNSLARTLYGPEGSLKLDWPTRQKICINIAKGLAFLHEESILKVVHRDIKSTNVLLDQDLNAKISDFGLAKLDEEEDTHISTRIAGTIGYMAPEYALRGYLTYKADVYSFGVVTLEIVAGKRNMNFRADANFVCLLDWALVLQQKGNLMELVDPRLGSDFNKEEAIKMVKIALLCTNPAPALRPIMSEVVRMLEGRSVVHELITDPSIYGDDRCKRFVAADSSSSGTQSLQASDARQTSDSATATSSYYEDICSTSARTFSYIFCGLFSGIIKIVYICSKSNN